MPMKLRLELVSPVRTDLLDTKREFFNDVIDEVDGIFLSMPVIDLQSPYASGIINGGVLIAFHVPHDTDSAQMILTAQIKNFLLYLRWGSSGMGFWNRPFPFKACFAKFSISVAL